MAIKITGLFKPGGNFPLIEDIDLLGGLRVVPTIADRDSIPELNLKEGMLVLVAEDNVTYQYKGNGVWEEYSMVSPTTNTDSAVVPTALNKIDIPPIVTGTDTLEDTIKKAWNIDIDVSNSHYNWPLSNGAFFFAGTYENKAVFTIQTDQILKGNTKIVIFTNNRKLDEYTTIDYTFKGLKASDNSSYEQDFTFTQIAPDSIWYKGELVLTEDVIPTGIEASDNVGSDQYYQIRGALWLCQISPAKTITIPEIEGIISGDEHIDYTIKPISENYANHDIVKYGEHETARQLVTREYVDTRINGHPETIEVVKEWNLNFTFKSDFNNELNNINHWELPTNGATDSDFDKTNHSGDDNSLIIDSVDGETPFIKLTNDKYFYNPTNRYIRRIYYIEWLQSDGHEYAFKTYVKYLMPNGEVVKSTGYCDLSDTQDEVPDATNMCFRAELLIPPKAKIVEFGAEYYSGNQWKLWFADKTAFEWKGSYFKIKGIDRILNDTSTSVDPTKELLTYQAVQNLLGDTTKNITWKKPVRTISLDNIDLSNIPNPLTIDDIQLVDGDRVALFGQTDGTENGIYIYNATDNTLERASDLAAGSHAAGATFIVEEGTDNGDTQWIITNDSDSDVVGTDELIAIKISGNAVYMNAPDPVPETHGGIEAGEIVDGLPVNEVLRRILFPYQYPSFTSFSIASQTQTLEVGDKVAGGTRTFNWSTTHDENIKENSIEIKDVNADTVLASGLANDGTEDIDIGSDKSLTSPGAYTWRISAQNTKNQTFSRDFAVRWYYRVYWGASTNDTLTADEVKNLSNSQLKAGFAGTYNFTASDAGGDYYYIVYPDEWGNVSKIYDCENNFGWDMTNAGTVDITNDYGIIITYRLFRTTYKQTADGCCIVE